MMAITLSTQMVFLTPISSFPTLVVYNSGTVTLMDIARSGIGPKLACLALQILSLEFLGWLIMDIKVSTYAAAVSPFSFLLRMLVTQRLVRFQAFPGWAQTRFLSRTGGIIANFTATTALVDDFALSNFTDPTFSF